ncbi:MAG: phospholipase D-like domain-containing protein [Candidatus Krumholzibacteriia bacterium]
MSTLAMLQPAIAPAALTCLLLSWSSPAAAAGEVGNTAPDRVVAAPAVADVGRLTWVESTPVETDLDLPGVPETAAVWRDVLGAARDSVEVLAFYLSEDPAGRDPLEPVLAALQTAGDRGVVVRVLADRGFHRTYPEIARQLDAAPGIAVRLLDARALWGGVQHAKAFAVDGRRFFVGSQNWDWRALMHIHELGALVESPELTRRFRAVFAGDWDRAQPLAVAEAAAGSPGGTPRTSAPAEAIEGVQQPAAGPGTALPPVPLVTAAGDTVHAVLGASPPQALPPGVPWDEPLLVHLLDGARRRIRVQLLSYNPSDRDGGYWAVLDDALRRAAARGVDVQMILADWSQRESMLVYVQSLAVLPRIEIRFTSIPPWSGGFVPFARVEHAKYVTVDDERCWLGTSNWSGGYFRESRNLSLFLEGEGACAVPDAFFEQSWNSAYAATVDPCGRYTPPRRQ